MRWQQSYLKTVLMMCCIIGFAASSAAQSLYDEDFENETPNNPGNLCTTSDEYTPPDNNWSLGEACQVQTNGRPFLRDYNGNTVLAWKKQYGEGDVVWNSKSIDVPDGTEVEISFMAYSRGDLEATGNAQDSFEMFAVIDGVEHSIFAQNAHVDGTSGGGNDNIRTFDFSDVIEVDGTSLSLRLKLKLSAANGKERYGIDAVSMCANENCTSCDEDLALSETLTDQTVECLSQLPTECDGDITVNRGELSCILLEERLASTAYTTSTPDDGISNNDDWMIILFGSMLNDADDRRFVPTGSGVSFTTYENGTAMISGQLVDVDDPTAILNVQTIFDNEVSGANWDGGFKAANACMVNPMGDATTNDWSIYLMNSGLSYLTGEGSLDGTYVQLSHMPGIPDVGNPNFGFQVGNAANNVNCEFGAGGWFYYNGVFDGVTMTNATGDFAFDLSGSAQTLDPCGEGESTVTLVYTAQDLICGDVLTVQQVWDREDTTDPTFDNAPADITINCDDDLPEVPTLTASDNCTDASGPTVAYVSAAADGDILPGSCPGNYTVTRQWTATDCSGNVATHTQTITVQDIDAPEVTLTCPEDATVYLDAACTADTDSSNTGAPSFTVLDNCDSDPEVTIGYSDSEPEYTCVTAGQPVLVDTWNGEGVYLDLMSYTGDVSITFTITEESGIFHSIIVPGVGTFEENDGTLNMTLTGGQIYGPCDAPNGTLYIGTEIPATAPEANGGIQLLLVEEGGDDWNDMVMTIDEGQWSRFNEQPTVAGQPIGDSSAQGSYTFTRTWTATATDDCDNTSDSETCEQLITVLDEIDPVITCPENTTVQCDGAGNASDLAAFLAGATATDNCDSEVEITHDYEDGDLSDGCGATGTVSVTFTATDDCGNTDTCTATFTIEDTTAPSIDTEAGDQTVQCGAGNADAFTSWLAANGNAAASDICGSVSWSNNSAGLSDDCGATGSETVTFTATDECGNKSTTMATFTIEDTTPPSIDTPAANKTVECGDGNAVEFQNWLAANGNAVASDLCGTVSWSNNSTGLSDDCGATGSETVTFTAKDECNNTATTTATFTIEDTTPPSIDTPAADKTVECGDGNAVEFQSWLAANGNAMASDLCGTVSWSNNSTGLSDDCGATGSETVTFTAKDECDNTVTTTATFTIQDTEAPTWDDYAIYSYEACENVLDPTDPTQAPITASDDCGTVTYSVQAFQMSGGCPGTWMRIWTATDECGNISEEAEQYLELYDNVDPIPVITCPADYAANSDALCVAATDTATTGAATATVTDNCDDAADIVITYSDSDPDEVCDGTFTITRTWTATATDHCDNVGTVTCDQLITISDVTAPTITSPAMDETVECDGMGNSPAFLDWLATQGDATAFDACSDVTWTNDYYTYQPADSDFGNTYGPDSWTLVTSGNQSSVTINDEGTELVIEGPLDEQFGPGGGVGFAKACQPARARLSVTFDWYYDLSTSWPNSGSYADPAFYINDEVIHLSATTLWGNQNQSGTKTIVVEQGDEFGWGVESFVFGGLGNAVLTISNFTTEVLPSQDPCQDEQRIVTFTASDDCGNTSSTTASFFIEDTTAPDFTGSDAEYSIACDAYDASTNYGLTVVEDCSDATITIVSNNQQSDQSACAGFIYRIYEAEDDCGNKSTFAQEITLTDDVNPTVTISCPSDYAVYANATCDNDLSPTAAGEAWFSADDNCDDDLDEDLSYDDSDTTYTCDNSFSFTRTWTITVTDHCGNEGSDSCEQTISITDNTAPAVPTLTCPEAATAYLDADCVADTDSSNTGVPLATSTDNCDSDPTINFTYVDGAATYSCDQSEQCFMGLYSEDFEDETPENADNLCHEGSAYEPADGNWSLGPACLITTNGIPQLIEDAGDTHLLFNNKYSADDVVFNSAEIDITGLSTVRIAFDARSQGDVENSGPYLDQFEMFIVVDGTETSLYQADGHVDGTDGGGDEEAVVLYSFEDNVAVSGSTLSLRLKVMISGAGQQEQYGIDNLSICSVDEQAQGSYSFTRTWTATATDDCGNTSGSTTCDQLITVLDEIDPTLSCPENTTVQCDGAGNAAALAAFLAGATATDNCDSEVEITHDYEDGDLSDLCGATGAVTVTFTATDDCGNSSTCSRTFTIEDTTAPSIDTEAGNQTVQCGAGNAEAFTSWLAANGNAAASDICGSVSWSNNSAGLSDDCGATGSETVTFTATDECGNTATTMATFTIEDTTPPSIDTPAADKTVECGDGNATEFQNWLAANGNATASDLCGTVSWSNNSTGLSDDCGATGSETVTFTATDECDNTATTTATFTIEDTTPPSLTIEGPESIDLYADANCYADTTVATLGTINYDADDNCGDATVVVTNVDSEVVYTCDADDATAEGSYSFTRTFTAVATDECSLTTTKTYVQTITVHDNMAPQFTSTGGVDNGDTESVCCESHLGEVTIPEAVTTEYQDNCDSDVALTYTETYVGAYAPTDDVDLFCLSSTPAAFEDGETCSGYDPHSLRIFALPGGAEFYTAASPGLVANNADGTLTITQSVQAADGTTAGWDLEVTYGVALGWADWSSQSFPTGYKRDCGDLIDDHINWEYRLIESGTLTGTGDYSGSSLSLMHAPSNNYYAGQFGLGANNMNDEYGYSGWFVYSGHFDGDDIAGSGDLFGDLDCCLPWSIDRDYSIVDDCDNSASFGYSIAVNGDDCDSDDALVSGNAANDHGPAVLGGSGDLTTGKTPIRVTNLQPNPTNDWSLLGFTVTENMRIRVDMVAMDGTLIAELYDGVASPNVNHTLDIEADDLDAGMYQVRLSSSSYLVVKKLLVSQ